MDVKKEKWFDDYKKNMIDNTIYHNWGTCFLYGKFPSYTVHGYGFNEKEITNFDFNKVKSDYYWTDINGKSHYDFKLEWRPNNLREIAYNIGGDTSNKMKQLEINGYDKSRDLSNCNKAI